MSVISSTPVFTSIPPSAINYERQFNKTNPSDNKHKTINNVPTSDIQPNSNSIRFSVARSEPSIIFRVHNGNAEGNNNVKNNNNIINNNYDNDTFVINSNINSTVPFYRWNDVHDGKESCVPFQVTRENSPALTILNVQSVDDNAQQSRLSSDIHFMIEDARANTNNSKYSDLYTYIKLDK